MKEMKRKTHPESVIRSACEAALAHQANGRTLEEAALITGVPYKTLWRWMRNLKAAEGDVDAVCQGKRTGRPVAFEPNDYEVGRARWFRLSKESLTVAAWFFARDEETGPHGETIRQELREVILEIEEKALRTGRKEAWPESVRRAFRVTEEEKAAFRSRKALASVEMVTRRGMFEVLADGSSREILAGETWELDDYSANQPFVFKDPSTGEFTLGRQVLAARDLASARWLGFDHIGRERDAYRGEDVLRYIERLVRSYGVPRRLRLERGVWESNVIHGIEIPGTDKRWGDLRDLMAIEHVFKSKGKAIIEGGFNVLQRWLGHTGTDIGRTRGEFEEATRRLRMAKSTGADPLALGFLTDDRSSILHSEAAAIINSRPMAREYLGGERVSADDYVSRQGWNTRPLRVQDEWYFRPYKAIRTVRGGTVNVTPGNGWRKQYFALNGQVEGVHLESGHQVFIAYDPARPELGAWVCNADKSARNRNGWRMGELLIQAAPEMGLAPQFDASASLSPHLLVRKKASAAAATTYRAVTAAAGLPQPSGTRETVVMNGRGAAAASSDMPQPANHSAPAAEVGPIPDSVRPLAAPREIRPATTSRAMPADPRAEIRRLQEALLED